MRCILIRHGQTAWNKDERFRGRANILLNDTGCDQAERVARALRGEPIAAIYAGPLQRTLDTAAPLGREMGLPVTPHPGLLDIDVGDWEGMSVDEARERYPDAYAQWLSAPHTMRIPGGEGLADVRGRVTALLDELYPRHRDDLVALVTHQAVAKVMMLVALGLEDSAFWRIVQDNACLNRLKREDGRCLVYTLNETCHLR